MELLLVTPRPEAWNECLPVFQRGGNTLQQAASLEDAAADHPRHASPFSPSSIWGLKERLPSRPSSTS